MKVYIIDYKTVGAEGVREIEQGVDGDAVFFVTGDPTNLPVQINSILDSAVKKTSSSEKTNEVTDRQTVPEKKEETVKQTVSEKREETENKTVSEKKEEPAKQKANKASKISAEVLKKARAAFSKAEESAKKKDIQSTKAKSSNKGSGISDEVKAELKEAVKPVGLKAIEYARLYKSFSESADKNEYNIALTRNFKIQKKANDIYRLTRPVFEAHKGN